MISRSARALGLTQTLNALAKMFGAEGWKCTVKPQRSLSMLKTAEENVEHTLLISEVLPPGEIDAENVVGLSCQVNVYFANLEKTINRVLGYDESTMGKLSLVLPLSQLAPKDHFYAGNVHLVLIDTQNFDANCQILREDFSNWLEPVRKHLEHQAVFENVAYAPPYVDGLSWELRRLAYRHLNSSDDELRDQIGQLEVRVEHVLKEASLNTSSFGRMKLNGLKRTSEEISKFIQHYRANANRASV